MMRLEQSRKILDQALRIIPEASQTVSKGPSQFVRGVTPSFLEKGRGSHVWDVDGNEYIDYLMALGAVILGYAYPRVTNAVKEVLTKGNSFTLPHRLEHELAGLLCELIPCAQMVRFAKNGSDVTAGAVRLARAYTGREKVACCGYHGCQDWFIATTARNKGIPEAVKKLTMTFQYNDIASLEELFAANPGEIACVIMEPVGMSEPQDNFLARVKDVAHRNGAVFILDEIVTGFRFSSGGAQQYFNVVPDLACFGKAMGNGFPISALVGRKKIMRLLDEVFFSYTFGGEIAAIAAAIASVQEIREKNVPAKLWRTGASIRDGYNRLAQKTGLASVTECVGFPVRNRIVFRDKRGGEDLLLKSLFQQECAKRGVLFTGNHVVCYRHAAKDIQYTLQVYEKVLKILARALSDKSVKKLLKGKPLRPVFRQ